MKKPTLSKSAKKRMKLLNYLLYQGEVEQKSFRGIFPTNIAYTTIIRHIQSLEYFGFIELTRQVRGKEKREWRLTPLGFLSSVIKNEKIIEDFLKISAIQPKIMPLFLGKWAHYEKTGVANTLQVNLKKNIDRLKKEFEPLIDNAFNSTLNEINQAKKMSEKYTIMQSVAMEGMIKYMRNDFPQYFEYRMLYYSFGLSDLSRIKDNDGVYNALSNIMKDEDLKKYISEYLKESLDYYHESYSNIRNWYERLCVE